MRKNNIYSLILLLALLLTGCSQIPEISTESPIYEHYDDFSDAYVTSDKVPSFNVTDVAYELYSPLDELGRVGIAEACLGPETMPTEDRTSISHVYPSGWNNESYEIVESGWLYNRCHMIGFQLSAENDTVENLMTGTRYFNVEGMLFFENKVADYIRRTGNHVMYRITPDFKGDELLARGVTMEMQSVETDDISLTVYIPNIQPGIEINYATGENRLSNEE